MSAPAFTVDVGNSSVGVATWSGDGPQLQRFEQPERAAEMLRGEVLVIAVAPERLARLMAALSRGVRATVLERPPTDLGAPGLVASAGADRLAVALALRPGPAVAVDAGTAVTVEIVDASGRYLGGFIAPGPAAAARGLSASAPRLPLLKGEPAALRPGVETQGAVSAGLWGLAVGGVDRLVLEALDVLGGGTAPRILATGGWAAAWARDSRIPGVELDPALVHRGIRRWGETS